MEQEVVQATPTGRGVLRPGLMTPVPDMFKSMVQDRKEYLTTVDLAKELKQDPKKIHRWCQRWYGALPSLRRGKGMGYRIHPDMRRVARGWLQTEDDVVRDAMRTALVKEPRDWVVVVGKLASTHYTAAEALERVEKVLARSRNKPRQVSVLYVGDSKTGE